MTTFSEMPTREQWGKLRYPKEVRPSVEEGGGYIASVPLLGGALCIADGETEAEALLEVERTRIELYDTYVRLGRPIPTPWQEPEWSREPALAS